MMIRKLSVFLKIRNFKDYLIEQQFLCRNKNYQQFDEKIKQLFFNTYKYFNLNNNKFILPLRKIVYPNDYLDDWKKFNEASLLEKEHIYSHVNMEDITYAVTHTQKDFIKFLK